MRLFARLALVMLLSLGLLLPRVSAALAVAAGFRTVVLCDGHGLTTLILGEADAPTGIAAHRDCALLHALAAPSAPLAGDWTPAALSLAFARPAAPQLPAAPAWLPQARAPPAA